MIVCIFVIPPQKEGYMIPVPVIISCCILSNKPRSDERSREGKRKTHSVSDCADTAGIKGSDSFSGTQGKGEHIRCKSAFRNDDTGVPGYQQAQNGQIPADLLPGKKLI